ncbi:MULTISPECIES: transketolase family protein [unclassified Saccharothrix]|uniref:transketolase family protein n=1 Tax=unclassified Saccharothrix TaxID=2593673 RepID=UPI00307D41A9
MSAVLSGREAYRAELTELARHDPRLVCFEADLGGRKHPFAQEHPNRFFNLGIAEATMIDMAAGLASAGYRPFVSTFAPFATLRAAESMKLSMGYLGAGVVVVAPYAGVSGAWFGTTHHCLEDLAVVQSFPGITIAAPYGEAETRAVIRAAAAGSGPFYVRTGRTAAAVSLPFDGELPLVNWADTGSSDVCVVSVGEVGTSLALAACEQRPELGHAHLCFVDHASLTAVAEQLRGSRYSRFVVVEEHRPTGGVASTLALLMPEVAVVGVNAGVEWPSEGGTHDEVLAGLGLDLAHVLAAV